MAARAHKRLTKEMGDVKNCQDAELQGVEINLVNDDMAKWNVSIPGPKGSPYEGGKFVVNLDYTDNYPFKCPKIKFVTKIYHPNIKTEEGEICAESI